MGAAVRRSEHQPFVAQHPLAQRPLRLGLDRDEEALEADFELRLGGKIEDRFKHGGTTPGGNVGDLAADQMLHVRRTRVTDHELRQRRGEEGLVGPLGQGLDHRDQFVPPFGIAQRGDPGRVIELVERGEFGGIAEADIAFEQVDPDAEIVRDDLRHDEAAHRPRCIDRVKLAILDIGDARIVEQDGVPVDRPAGLARHVGEQPDVVPAWKARNGGAGDEFEARPRMIAAGRGERDKLVMRGELRRGGPFVAVELGPRGRRGEADRARAERLADQRAHRRDLVAPRRALRSVLAHHEAAHRSVADHHADIDRQLLLRNMIEIGGEAVPGEFDPLPERFDRDRLDPRQQADEEVAVLGARRCQRNPAIAGDHCRHSVKRRGRKRPVPQQLRVIMGVDVNEAGRDHPPLRVDLAPRGPVDLTDERNTPFADRDIAAARRSAGSVDQQAVADDQVIHRATPHCVKGRA